MATIAAGPRRYDQFAWHYDQLTANLYRPGEATFYGRLARQSAGPVLEPACGAGRMLAIAQAAGCAVWGTDLSQPMLDLAAARLGGGPEVHLACRDLRELADGPFALVMLPLEAFRLLPDPASQIHFLTALRSRLRPDGRLALDLTLPEAVFPEQVDARLLTGPNGAMVSSTTSWVRTGGCTVERTEFAVRRRGSRPSKVQCEDAFRDISADELRALLTDAGWRIMTWDSDFRGTSYRPGDAQLVVVAEAGG